MLLFIHKFVQGLVDLDTRCSTIALETAAIRNLKKKLLVLMVLNITSTPEIQLLARLWHLAPYLPRKYQPRPLNVK